MARQAHAVSFMGEKGSLQRRVLFAVFHTMTVGTVFAIWVWDIFGNDAWVRLLALVVGVMNVPGVVIGWARVVARLRQLDTDDEGVSL